jgi:16S rRNA (cytosine1402-N4)-methyltransferase
MEHIPVLLTEALDALAVRPDGVYVDCTFGRGGHSRGLLARLGPAGRLVALDRDPTAIAAGQALSDARFTLVHARFAELANVLDDLGVTAVDGVLLDVGVSSPQLDEAARGMSFRQDAPLDMRMDTSRGETVAQWLARADEADIKEVIRDYGEERFASAIAKAIVAARGERPVDTTYQLAQIVAATVRTREAGQHPATRSFQALRIFINKELEELSLVLPQALDVLKPSGRLRGDLLPFAGRPHRQALHGRSGQSAATPARHAAARRPVAEAEDDTDRAHPRRNGRSRAQPARAQRHAACCRKGELTCCGFISC